MKTVKIVETETDGLRVGFVDDDNNYVVLEEASAIELAEIAERKDIIPILIQIIMNLTRDIREETVGNDLVALWERMDELAD